MIFHIEKLLSIENYNLTSPTQQKRALFRLLQNGKGLYHSQGPLPCHGQNPLSDPFKIVNIELFYNEKLLDMIFYIENFFTELLKIKQGRVTATTEVVVSKLTEAMV